MEEMLIIPWAEAPHLVRHYSQKLLENDRLRTAATLAAKIHRILTDPTFTANAKNALLKPFSRRLRQSKKRLRSVSLGITGVGGEDEEDSDDNDMSTPAAEKIMRKLVKVVKTPKAKAKPTPGPKPKVPPGPSLPPTTLKRPPLSLMPEDILFGSPKYEEVKARASGKAPPPTPTPPTPPVVMSPTMQRAEDALQKLEEKGFLPSGVTTRR